MSGPAGYGLGELKVAFAVEYLLRGVDLRRVAHHRRALQQRWLEQRGVLVDPLHRAVRRTMRRGPQDG